MNKRVKLARSAYRLDGMYIFVILFCLAGSLTLFRSYADNKPKATFAPGVYQLADFATDAPNRYAISIHAGYQYCLQDATVVPSVVVTARSIVQPQPVTTVRTAVSTCFTSKTDVRNAVLILESSSTQPKTLSVSI